MWLKEEYIGGKPRHPVPVQLPNRSSSADAVSLLVIYRGINIWQAKIACSLVVAVKVSIFCRGAKLANFHCLVAVSVSALTEGLVAIFADKGPLTCMRSQVVEHVAKLGEVLAAGEALKDLVLTLGDCIHDKSLPVALLFVDLLAGFRSRSGLLLFRLLFSFSRFLD